VIRREIFSVAVFEFDEEFVRIWLEVPWPATPRAADASNRRAVWRVFLCKNGALEQTPDAINNVGSAARHRDGRRRKACRFVRNDV
jgi:hypothetical protein